MYYHAVIERPAKNRKDRFVAELNETSPDSIIEQFFLPYLKGESFFFSGYRLSQNNIERFTVYETKDESSVLKRRLQDSIRTSGFIYAYSEVDAVTSKDHSKDITKDIINKCQVILSDKSIYVGVSENIEAEKSQKDPRVFIVHGHDDVLKLEVSSFLSKIGLKPIVLHQQASGGSTIIEKIEKYSKVGFGVVLYSACDVGAKNVLGVQPDLKPRARQNVVFEHGYLIGKLSRSHVCAIVKGQIETPNDISGVVYISHSDSSDWKIALMTELRASGYSVSFDSAFSG